MLKNDKPVGMVTDSDIVTIGANGKKPDKVKIKDVPKRRRGFISAGPNESLMDVTFIKSFSRSRFPAVLGLVLITSEIAEDTAFPLPLRRSAFLSPPLPRHPNLCLNNNNPTKGKWCI